MGFLIDNKGINEAFKELSKNYLIFAPKCFVGEGAFSDTDSIRYGQVSSIEEIVFDKKSHYSFKEVLLPISQTLFYFTEETIKEAEDRKKSAIVFLRSCDLNAVKRIDEMYLNNGSADYYYKRTRDKIKFVLMGCENPFENCFCVDMNTNKAYDYSMSIDISEEGYLMDCKDEEFKDILSNNAKEVREVIPKYVEETETKVNIPETLTEEVSQSKIWDEYDSRCINCGRCNFVCPTCTCFTMQDLFYSENGKVGERRRIWSSCMVDGFTNVAGGGVYRKKNGQRMRFKVLHKVLNFKKRHGYHMCVGCGRCDDICPEYISFSNCINKLEKAMEEVSVK